MRKKARHTSTCLMVLICILLTLPVVGIITWQVKIGVPSDGPMFVVTLLSLLLPVGACFSPLKGRIAEHYEAKYHKEWLEDDD